MARTTASAVRVAMPREANRAGSLIALVNNHPPAACGASLDLARNPALNPVPSPNPAPNLTPVGLTGPMVRPAAMAGEGLR